MAENWSNIALSALIDSASVRGSVFEDLLRFTFKCRSHHIDWKLILY